MIVCSCGGQMKPEVGRLFGDDFEPGDSHTWLWWRCVENPTHLTRALPLPVRMARSV